MPIDVKRGPRPALQSLPLCVVLALVACAAPEEGRPAGVTAEAPPAEPAAATLDLTQATLVDLSHTYDDETVYWPTSPTGFELEELAHGETEDGYFYSAYSLCTPEHGGTHLDSPVHFARDGWTVEQVPVERLIVPAAVIDVSDRAATDPDYRLTVDDVTSWETGHGRVESGSAVLLHTGWSRFWPDARAYLGDDTPGDASNLHFPSFGPEAASLLIEERGVVMLGVDTASIDHGPSTRFEVHQIAGAANVPGLENLTGLDRLPATGSWVIALPMKIGGGSGAPVRVVGVVP